MNQHAGLVIAEADGLRAIQNSLCATNPNSHRSLRRAIERAGRTGTLCTDTATEIITVCRSSGRESLEILVTPLHRQLHTASVLGAPSMAVLIWDPEKTPPFRPERIRHIYRLTAAEARVTEGLARGMAVIELAREMRVQANTLRTHLRHRGEGLV